jgi:hypothetical protein
VFVLLTSAEIVVRVKYFFAHKRDWNYITMPYRVQDTQALDHAFFKLPENALAEAAAAASKDAAQKAAATPKPAAATPAVATPPAATPAAAAPPAAARPSATPVAAAPSEAAPPSAPADASVAAASSDQMKFKWVRPCRDREVFSQHYQKPMPFTWDANCFRGDSVTTSKPAGEVRIFVVGGSTVEDAQPDVDMWTRQLKLKLDDPRIKVVNAGQTSMGSSRMTTMYESKVSLFKPDLLLYYEGWNEQTDFGRLAQIEQQLGAVTNRLHKALHYKSLLYTYLVEKYSFMTTQDVKLWKIDVKQMQDNLERLSRVVKRSGTQLVFITQVTRTPRTWKGVDTFDGNALEGLLDRLQADKSYAYDTEEISALNQRLAVARSIELFRRLNVPIINILDEVEALGVEGRKPLFIDLGHLTWQGDHFVGKLVGQKLAALGVIPGA